MKKERKLHAGEDVCTKTKCDGIMIRQPSEDKMVDVWICDKCGTVEVIEQ